MKLILLTILSLLLVGCSDSERGTVPLGKWIEVSPDDPEAIKALRAINRSPHSVLVSARIKAEQAFMHYELIFRNKDTKWTAKVVKERFRMINVKKLPDGSSGGTLVPAGDHTDYQLQTLTSIRGSEIEAGKTGDEQGVDPNA
ncbi:MAG: hypothetical protein AAF591_17090 [Verrucomicrobiota bacterium]